MQYEHSGRLKNSPLNIAESHGPTAGQESDSARAASHHEHDQAAAETQTGIQIGQSPSAQTYRSSPVKTTDTGTTGGAA